MMELGILQNVSTPYTIRVSELKSLKICINNLTSDNRQHVIMYDYCETEITHFPCNYARK